MIETTKMPERIYLQLGDDESEWPGEIVWSDVTWCDEQIFESDQLYVRSDRVSGIEKQRDDLVKSYLEQAEAMARMREQRDELLEALVRALPHLVATCALSPLPKQYRDDLEAVQVAIARAKGGAL